MSRWECDRDGSLTGNGRTRDLEAASESRILQTEGVAGLGKLPADGPRVSPECLVLARFELVGVANPSVPAARESQRNDAVRPNRRVQGVRIAAFDRGVAESHPLAAAAGWRLRSPKSRRVSGSRVRQLSGLQSCRMDGTEAPRW